MNAPLKIVFLTPGTGGWYCGACMRDNALAKALQAAGHEVSLLPMYLPLQLDEEVLASARATPVFFGGINVFLQHKFACFRHTPRWLDRLLNHPRLLRRVARHSHMTSARDHGEMTLAMLRLEHGELGKELDKLCEWLARDRPDILCLSTALQAGMIRELKRRLGVRVICCFQGEDSFLDSLPEPFRAACWRELALRVREADALVSPSAFYANLMESRLGPDAPTIRVIPNGINLAGYAPLPDKPGPPVIGFLARLARDKGLEIMVDAFIHLRTVLGHPDARLHLAGSATADHAALIEELKERLAAAGLSDQVRWQMNLSREEKAAMLRALSLFSVPAIYPEAFGLYVIEAMASGVPVVQPAVASFPEIVGRAGVLVGEGRPVAAFVRTRPNASDGHASDGHASDGHASDGHASDGHASDGHASDGHRPPLQVALARAWFDLLAQPEELRAMGTRSRRTAEESYAVEVMRDRFVALAREVRACQSPAPTS